MGLGRLAFPQDPVAVRDTIAELRQEIARLDLLYHQAGESTVSDAEYDRLRQRLGELERTYPAEAAAVPALAGFGDDRNGQTRTRRHREPMLSLDKAYTEAELRAFHSRLAKRFGLEDLEYVVEPKYDGLAVSLVYAKGRLAQAITRGNGAEGDDITAAVRAIPGVPRKLRGGDAPNLIEVRGEIFVPLADFGRVNAERERAGESPFASPRALAVGTVRQSDPGEVASRGLQVVCFGVGACEPDTKLPGTQTELTGWLRACGLPVVGTTWPARGEIELVRAVAEAGRERSRLGGPTDGVVIKVNSRALQSAAGLGVSAPRWAVAYKFAPERSETRLLGVRIQVGRTGVLSPVAELSPVVLGGSTVTRATLHNRAEIARRDLRIGDTVIVEKAGDVIPAVVGVNLALRPPGARVFTFPRKCPECRAEVEVGETVVRCLNWTCPAQLRRRLEHFASKACVDIPGLGPALIDRLVATGWVTDLPDLYRLRREDLLTLNRNGDKSVDRLLEAIERSKKAELWRFIHGLGLPKVGAAAAKELARRHGSLEALAAADPRCGDLVAAFVARGVQPALATPIDGPLAGRTFVLTGTLVGLTREQAEEKIEAAGGRVAGAVSGKTHFVVAGAEPGAKLTRARELGIAVLDEAAFLRMLEGR
ncbi:MAG: NAD-dependent DNA ligase LigA [Verrucomicrobia bacterium]|nr:NAD-dependent DNA ligase LigA [Verrucomicrobiota bacterium]